MPTFTRPEQRQVSGLVRLCPGPSRWRDRHEGVSRYRRGGPGGRHDRDGPSSGRRLPVDSLWRPPCPPPPPRPPSLPRPDRRPATAHSHTGRPAPAALMTALVLLGALVAAVLPSLVLAPAASAAPASRTPSRTIEVYSRYQPQTTCSPQAKPGVVSFMKMALRSYPGTGSSGIVRACAKGGRSEHKEGRAWDWRLSYSNARQRQQASDMVRWLFATDALRQPAGAGAPARPDVRHLEPQDLELQQPGRRLAHLHRPGLPHHAHALLVLGARRPGQDVVLDGQGARRPGAAAPGAGPGSGPVPAAPARRGPAPGRPAPRTRRRTRPPTPAADRRQPGGTRRRRPTADPVEPADGDRPPGPGSGRTCHGPAGDGARRSRSWTRARPR